MDKKNETKLSVDLLHGQQIIDHEKITNSETTNSEFSRILQTI